MATCAPATQSTPSARPNFGRRLKEGAMMPFRVSIAGATLPPIVFMSGHVAMRPAPSEELRT
eukprot:7333068-Prymnesium_polylepis.1